MERARAQKPLAQSVNAASRSELVVAPRADTGAVLRAAFDLSWKDLYVVDEAIAQRLAATGTREPAVEQQLRERAEALQALQSVARHLGLPDGIAPRVHEYDRAASELGLALRSGAIIRRWVTWGQAKKAVVGEHVVETQAARAQRRHLAGRRRTHADYLDGVRAWLTPRLPDATPSTTTNGSTGRTKH